MNFYGIVEYFKGPDLDPTPEPIVKYEALCEAVDIVNKAWKDVRDDPETKHFGLWIDWGAKEVIVVERGEALRIYPPENQQLSVGKESTW